jgi:hypothetical protein
MKKTSIMVCGSTLVCFASTAANAGQIAVPFFAAGSLGPWGIVGAAAIYVCHRIYSRRK